MIMHITIDAVFFFQKNIPKQQSKTPHLLYATVGFSFVMSNQRYIA
jgi:hypothetical protein